MNRPVSLRAYCAATGYTLVEILVATTLTLMLMGAVVAMFGRVGEGIGDSRSMLEAAERLRLAATRLQMDLTGVTVNLSNPWCRPEDNMGYFEYIDGGGTASTTNATGVSNDILMFTTRSTGRPFVGRSSTATIQSDVAEVAWFVRDGKLYRRTLLVSPSASVAGSSYADCDVSVNKLSSPLVANTLGDLTKRENRFAHNTTPFPFTTVSPIPKLSDVAATRTDDVILTNVIGFDVKYYDTNTKTYIDLTAAPNAKSGLAAGVYSTWPTYYEYVGTVANDPLAGRAVNGFDDDSNGIVDDATELITSPPYSFPLRGIQVKIRTLEPDSKQVREVTVVQDFLPQ